jgi:hypothetical protein
MTAWGHLLPITAGDAVAPGRESSKTDFKELGLAGHSATDDPLAVIFPDHPPGFWPLGARKDELALPAFWWIELLNPPLGFVPAA